MGTWVDLSIRDPSDPNAALADVETLLASFEKDYYAWTPGQLADLNDAIARGERADVSAELAVLLLEAPDEVLMLPRSIEKSWSLEGGGVVPRYFRSQHFENYRRFVTEGRLVGAPAAESGETAVPRPTD